jgi:hypothetical protein
VTLDGEPDVVKAGMVDVPVRRAVLRTRTSADFLQSSRQALKGDGFCTERVHGKRRFFLIHGAAVLRIRLIKPVI